MSDPIGCPYCGGDDHNADECKRFNLCGKPDELMEYAGPVYAMIAVAGLLALAYLSQSIWRPQWLT